MPAACSLLLEVYQLGGLLVDWEVSTDPNHFHPYLLGPQNYEGQTVDPISAAASIGTVEVGVIDPARTPGDQTTGWMTEKVGSIRGRRCRLRRWIDELVGWITIADGPAGVPRLDGSYSAYRWPIKDTREIERKIKAFGSGGSTGLVPRGPILGFGQLPDDAWLIDPIIPIRGVYFVTEGPIRFGRIEVGSYALGKEGLAAIQSQGDGIRSVFPYCDVLWRIADTDDPWNVARPVIPAPYVNGELSIGSLDSEGNLTDVILWTHKDGDSYDGTEAFGASGVDGVGDTLEFIIRHRGPASKEYPYYFEGLDGDLIAMLYDGLLSGVDPIAQAARERGGDLHDPANFDAITEALAGSTRYDPDAVAAMVDRVLLRQTDPVDDGRDWAEKAIYGPSGWMPALDSDARISPVSRHRPSTIDGPLINNDIAEPSPDWNAGEIVVTRVEVTYNRYFVPAPELASLYELELDGLAIKPIDLQYIDAEAEANEGQQPQTYDASAFSAAGDDVGDALVGDVESGSLLAQSIRYEVLGRYRAGAQSIMLRLRRQDVPALRVGDWCPVALTWLPNYLTGLRGNDLVAVQVLSINDSECAWRYVTLEESPVFAPPGYFDSIELELDEEDTGS